MDIFKITKQIGNCPPGTLGIIDEAEHGNVTLKIGRDPKGYWIKIEVPECELEVTDAKVDSFTGDILSSGYRFREDLYTSDMGLVKEYCMELYGSVEEAHKDGFFEWCEWVPGSFVFPYDLDNVKYEIIKPTG